MYNTRLANLNREVLAIMQDNISVQELENTPLHPHENYIPSYVTDVGIKTQQSSENAYKRVDEVLGDGLSGRYGDIPADPQRSYKENTSESFTLGELQNLEDENLRIVLTAKVVYNIMSGSDIDVSADLQKANELLKKIGDWNRSKEIDELKEALEKMHNAAGAGVSKNYPAFQGTQNDWKVAYRLGRSLERKYTRRRLENASDWMFHALARYPNVSLYVQCERIKETGVFQLSIARSPYRKKKSIYLRKSILGNAPDVTVKALEDSESVRGESKDQSSSAHLEINLGSLRFDDHYLFSHEDYLYSSIQLLYDEYADITNSSLFDSIDKRLRNILPLDSVEGVQCSLNCYRSGDEEAASTAEIAAWEKAFSEFSASDVFQAAEEVVSLLQSRQDEWTYVGHILTKMWFKWKELESLRAQQQHVSTPVRLETQQVLPVDAKGTMNERAKVSPQFFSHSQPAKLEPRADEVDAWFEAVSSLDSWMESLESPDGGVIGFGGLVRRDVLCAVEGLLATLKKQNSSSMDAKEGNGAVSESQLLHNIFSMEEAIARKDRSRIASTISNGYKILRTLWRLRAGDLLYDNNNSPGGVMGDGRDYVFNLVHDSRQITDDTLVPPQERRRRRHVTETKYYARVLVNGRELEGDRGYLSSRQLQWPSFKVDFNESITIRPYHRPSSVEMRLYRSTITGVHSLSEHVSTLLLPIPGSQHQANMPATSIGPIRGPFQFSARTPMPPQRRAWSPRDESSSRQYAQRRMMGSLKGEIRWINGLIPDVPVRILISNKNLHTVTGIPDARERNRKNAAKLSASAAGAFAVKPENALKDIAMSESKGMIVDPNDPHNLGLVETGTLQADKSQAVATVQGDRGSSFRESVMEYHSAFVTPRMAAEAGVGITDIVGTSKRAMKEKFETTAGIQELQGKKDRFSQLALQVLSTMSSPSSLAGGGKRQRLLSLRAQYPQAFNKEWHLPIPVNISDIRNSTSLQRILALDDQGQFGKEQEEEDEDAEQETRLEFTRGAGFQNVTTRLKRRARTKAKEYLARVRQSRAGYKKYHSHKELSHVVKDVDLPTVRKLDFTALANAFQPVRPLNPGAKKGKNVRRDGAGASSMAEMQTFTIRLQIARARNLPVRATEQRAAKSSRPPRVPEATGTAPAIEEDDYEDLSSVNDLLCFVEASFRGRSSRTRAVSGDSPIWNQVLEIPFRPPGDNLSPSALATIRDDITISLFDEELVEGKYRERNYRTTTATRREARFLGSVTIPFSSLFSQRRLQGEVRLRTPPVVFGYAPFAETDMADRIKRTRGNVSKQRPNKKSLQSNADSNTFAAHVFFAANIEPSLPSPPPVEDEIANTLGMNRWKRLNMRKGLYDGIVSKHGAIPRPMSEQSILSTFLSSISNALGCRRQTQKPQTESTETDTTTHGSKSGIGVISERSFNEKLRHAYEWSKRHSRNGENVKAVVETIEKKPFLITQYLTKQRPPPHVDYSRVSEEDIVDDLKGTVARGEPFTTKEQCVRFVSMIPFLGDFDLFGRNADVWATSAQTLEMGAADWEEHAILLHNYILGLDTGRNENWKTYLALGKTVLHGEATYVARVNLSANEMLLIDPLSGIAYDGKDISSPFISIDMFATPENCYANIQPKSEPWYCNFDVTNDSEWAPLWENSENPSSEISTIQSPIKYIQPPQEFIDKLEDDITEHVKTDFIEWRRQRHGTNRTFFRKDLEPTVVKVLGELEQEAQQFGTAYGIGDGGTSASFAKQFTEKHINDLSRSFSRYQAFGFPINRSFRDVADISAAVRATGIHRTENDRAEFVLGVKVHPYPNYIFSCWVYLIALVPK
eukprot:gb/GECG01010918.1/.p1 GENE.gb/GECG01010918.1/~~gb/GECG01010918.1/.p1  ORF type:complete len:1826 (+),score=230.35 gb/GECG01010918.1/:1-5478(+)